MAAHRIPTGPRQAKAETSRRKLADQATERRAPDKQQQAAKNARSKQAKETRAGRRDQE